MSGVPDNHELARQLAVLEERMNTHQADYRAALERMERRMADRDAKRDTEAVKRDAKRDTELAKRHAEIVKRDKANIQWMAGLGIAVITSIIGGFVILGLLTT